MPGVGRASSRAHAGERTGRDSAGRPLMDAAGGGKPQRPAAKSADGAPAGQTVAWRVERAQWPAGGASDSSSFIAARKRRTVVSSASPKRARARAVASASGMK